MAKNKKEIRIDGSTLSVKEIVEKGENAPLTSKIAAMAILKEKIEQVQGDLSQLKKIEEMVSADIETTGYNVHIDELVKDGELTSKEQKPIFFIKTKPGAEIKVTMCEGKDERFKIDSSLSAKATLDIIPDRYKNVSVTLNKKAIEGDYNAGILPETFKSYCSKSPIDITKIKVTIDKKKEESK